MPSVPPVSYTVTCECGRTAEGPRGRSSQVVTCANCGKRLFIFPMWPAPMKVILAATGQLQRPRWLEVWLPPVAGGAAALLLVVLTVSAILMQVEPRPGGPPLTPAAARQRADELERPLSALFAEGSYSVARARLAELLELHRQFPGDFAPGDQKLARKRYRQVDLLADLLAEPIDELARHAMALSEREWAAVFAARYAGRGVIFDTSASAPSAGALTLDYPGRAGDTVVRPDAGSIELLRMLPLRRPQRVLIGARLAAIRPDGPRGWRAVFRPDSGVLFTDPAILTGLSLAIDADLLDVLRRQKTWSDELTE